MVLSTVKAMRVDRGFSSQHHCHCYPSAAVFLTHLNKHTRVLDVGEHVFNGALCVCMACSMCMEWWTIIGEHVLVLFIYVCVGGGGGGM